MLPVRFYKNAKTGEVILSLEGENDTELVLLNANSTDAAKEKHVPEVRIEGNKVNVQVGSVAHPMLENHYITMITLVTNKKAIRRNLKPGEAPVAEFNLIEGEKPVAVYEYCNLHGLWVKEL